MDVTSMLNSSSAANKGLRLSADGTPTPSAVEGITACSSADPTPSPEKTPSRRTSESKTPNRSRTPWDAGGYSLPLTLDTKTPQTTSVRQNVFSESPAGSASPKSPRHKFSDSHSSLSSYTSSSNSVSHSRFSSMSTVSGGFPTMSSIYTDMPILDSKACDNLDSANSRTSMPELARKLRKDGGSSPTTIAEEPSMPGSRRPGSPSDAMLISRGSPQETANPRDLKNDLNYLIPPDLPKSHKRAVSAPDFAALNVTIDQTFGTGLQHQALQPTPPPSHQGDCRSSYTMDTISTSPVNSSVPSAEEPIKCMYVDNCDTGSQPRKAISHIFGRNKLCTRMIPQHVWVHFCRKHYQRSRYRNAQEYAKLQCELVQKQIRRVQAWSDENKRLGNPGVVQDWSLSVRKREQKRLEDRGTTSKKRPYRDESEDDDDTMDRAVLNGTAVPQWLLHKCKSGYQTSDIEEIVAQLKTEMDTNNLTQIPDIEILPNIITDAPEDGKKMMIKRKSSTASSHKRSQSVGVGLRPDSFPMTRRISQPSFTGQWRAEDALHSSPIEKRQRTDFSIYGDRHVHMGLPQVPERGVPQMRRITHLPHRPAFSHIRENQTEEAYFEEEDRTAHYGMGGPLPAPTPQRLAPQPMAAQLETTSMGQAYMDTRRPSHQRSVSEMTFNQHPNFTYRPSSSAGFPPVTQGYATDTMPYDASSYMRAEAAFVTGPPGYYDEPVRSYAPAWPTQPTHTSAPYATTTTTRHMRHQSTPIVPQVVPRMSPVDQDPYSATQRPSGPFDAQNPYHRRQPSYSRMGYQETDHTKALYGERR